MVVETKKWYCDACGKELKNYHGMITVVDTHDDEGYVKSIGFDFCKDCMASFGEWRNSRKAAEQRTE